MGKARARTGLKGGRESCPHTRTEGMPKHQREILILLPLLAQLQEGIFSLRAASRRRLFRLLRCLCCLLARTCACAVVQRALAELGDEVIHAERRRGRAAGSRAGRNGRPRGGAGRSGAREHRRAELEAGEGAAVGGRHGAAGVCQARGARAALGRAAGSSATRARRGRRGSAFGTRVRRLHARGARGWASQNSRRRSLLGRRRTEESRKMRACVQYSADRCECRLQRFLSLGERAAVELGARSEAREARGDGRCKRA
jgi:hypothetical protein